MTYARKVVTFPELRAALSAGWVLHQEVARHPCGSQVVSDDYYVLKRNRERRNVHQRTVVAAIRNSNLEPYGAITPDGSKLWRWRETRK